RSTATAPSAPSAVLKSICTAGSPAPTRFRWSKRMPRPKVNRRRKTDGVLRGVAKSGAVQAELDLRLLRESAGPREETPAMAAFRRATNVSAATDEERGSTKRVWRTVEDGERPPSRHAGPDHERAVDIHPQGVAPSRQHCHEPVLFPQR